MKILTSEGVLTSLFLQWLKARLHVDEGSKHREKYLLLETVDTVRNKFFTFKSINICADIRFKSFLQ